MTTKKKSPPYASTTVPAETSQAQIQKMLYNYGAEATRWTTAKDGITTLEFIFRVDGNPVSFRLTPPLFVDRHQEPKHAQSMRLLYWYLKAKLEAVEYGLVTVEHEFMADIAGELPDGSKVTLADVLLKKVASGGLLAADNFLKELGAGSG